MAGWDKWICEWRVWFGWYQGGQGIVLSKINTTVHWGHQKLTLSGGDWDHPLSWWNSSKWSLREQFPWLRQGKQTEGMSMVKKALWNIQNKKIASTLITLVPVICNPLAVVTCMMKTNKIQEELIQDRKGRSKAVFIHRL